MLCYAVALYLWTLLLPAYMAVLTRVAGVIWPLVSAAGVSLRLEGLEIVAQTAEFYQRVRHVDRLPFTSVTFLALALATSRLRLDRRLKLIAIGLLILFGSYVLSLLLWLEDSLAGWYFSPRRLAAGEPVPFAYSQLQAQLYAGLLSFWVDMGQHMLPIVVWAGLVLFYSRDKAGSWARRLLG